MANSLKTISNTFLFKEYDTNINFNTKISKMIGDAEFLTQNDLEFQLREIEKRFYFSSKNQVLNDFKEGKVKLLYVNSMVATLPNILPCFLINNGKGIICCVNISNYATKNAKGEFNIDTKLLYALLQSGTILIRCFTHFKALKMKSSFLKYGSYMYSAMFSKIINRMFSLNISPEKQDIANYFSSLFFLNNLVGRDEPSMSEMNKKYALENCKSTSSMILSEYDRAFTSEDFKDLDTFIRALASNIPVLSSLTTRNFTDNYIKQYGPNMLFALEFLPIFLNGIFCIPVGAFLNNQNIIENMFGNDIDKFANDFFSMFK